MEYDERDSEEIRALILNTLHDIRGMISIDFKVEVKPDTKLGEHIVVRLPAISTGIQKTEKSNENKTFDKSGAKIIFHQIYSNGTEVSYRMSHIEGLTKKAKTVLQDTAPRTQINRQYIIEKFLGFLQQVVNFEKIH